MKKKTCCYLSLFPILTLTPNAKWKFQKTNTLHHHKQKFKNKKDTHKTKKKKQIIKSRHTKTQERLRDKTEAVKSDAVPPGHKPSPTTRTRPWCHQPEGRHLVSTCKIKHFL